jgi:hypothetical protein
MPQQPRAVVWVVTLAAGLYEARLFLVEKTGLDSTEVVLRSDSLATLVSLAPDGMKRIPRFPTQPVAVVENWF